MKDEQELYDFIDDYLKGDPQADLPKVEDMDLGELSQEIAYQKVLKDAVVLNRLSQLSETIHKVDQQAQFKKKVVKYTVLVALLAALVSTGIFFYSKEKSNHTKTTLTTSSEIIVDSPSKTVLEISSDVKPTQTVVTNTMKEPQGVPAMADKPSESQEKPVAAHPEQETAKHSLLTSPDPNPERVPIPEKTVTHSLVDCKQVKIKANYTFENPCVGQNNGQITIEEISGGTKPYTFSIDNAKGFATDSEFKDLNSGHYKILIKDAHDCISDVIANVSLTETTCDAKDAQSHVFNPSRESWEIPNQKEHAGTVEIYNNRGILVYRANFNKFETLNWNGTSPQGEQISPGVYIYRIQYENSTSEKGSVSVVY